MNRSQLIPSRWTKVLIIGFFLLILNSAYLISFGSPTMFYIGNVLLHITLGLALTVALAILLPRWWKFYVTLEFGVWQAGQLFLAPAVVTGIWLMFVGGTRPNRWLLTTHIVIASVSCISVIFHLILELKFWRRTSTIILFVAIIFPIGVLIFRQYLPNPDYLVKNPINDVPTSMYEEGGGSNSPFFPSSSETATGQLIPTNFFLTSQTCAASGCHPDTYQQWHQSAHHFSSFNNQWYRKSIVYMQDVNGIQSSKFCGGCHDPAILFNGTMDRPIRENIHTPEAQAGLACTACHSIERVKDTVGNGGYVIKYPPLHEIAASKNPFVRQLHNYLIRLDPEPHRRSFLKPFHYQNTAEFCSTCHKVHLDEPINNFRWFRGFNTYDQWQSSGVSHQGALSFYYPEKPMKCTDCHMPLVDSQDAANINGKIHSHRFPAANTALPFVNRHQEQLETVKSFLQNDQVTVDIFAVNDGNRVIPVEETILQPGQDVRVEVVVRTRNVGHHFPAGTIDAFNIWLELKATNESGEVIFWSGYIEAKDGNGPVDPSAHFYKSYPIDAHGNPINKRNAWAARTVVYNRTIPPGAADTVHFRLKIPENCGDKITLQARLNHRKFNWWHTQWAYAGIRDPDDTDFALDKSYDDGQWIFSGDTSQVAGKVKQIPNLPIVTMAEDLVTIPVGDKNHTSGSKATASESSPIKLDNTNRMRERWNDYGIGLLLQGDLKGAESAFLKVTELEPEYLDGWINIARCRIAEGNVKGAQEMLDQAMKIQETLDPQNPHRAKVHYFYALSLKPYGRYDEALNHLRQAANQFPRDKIVRNEIGRLLYLQRKYNQAIKELKKTLAVDPENLNAHYNLMLCYRAAGNKIEATRAEKLYRRFKTDESMDRITGLARRADSEANRERQPVHVHTSSYGRSQATPSVPVPEQ